MTFALRFTLVLLLCSSSLHAVSYMRVDPNVIAQRLKGAPVNQQDALERLREEMRAVGVDPQQIQEQAVPGEPVPNLVVTMPGTELGAIVIAAPSEISKDRSLARVQWGTLEMLALLAESWSFVKTRHRLVLVAYSEKRHFSAGLEAFLAEESTHGIPHAVIRIRELGRSRPCYSTLEGNDDLIAWLQLAARDLKMPSLQGYVLQDSAQAVIRTKNSIVVWSPQREWRGGAEATRAEALYGVPTALTELQLPFYIQTYDMLSLFLIEADSVTSIHSQVPIAGKQKQQATVSSEAAEELASRAMAKMLTDAGLSVPFVPSSKLRKSSCGLARNKRLNQPDNPGSSPEIQRTRDALLKNNRVLYAFVNKVAHPGDVGTSPPSDIAAIQQRASEKGIRPVSYSVGACAAPGPEKTARWWIIGVVNGSHR